FGPITLKESPIEALANKRDPEDRAIIFEEQPRLVCKARRRPLALPLRYKGLGKLAPLPLRAQGKSFASGTAEAKADDTFLRAFLFPPPAFSKLDISDPLCADRGLIPEVAGVRIAHELFLRTFQAHQPLPIRSGRAWPASHRATSSTSTGASPF